MQAPRLNVDASAVLVLVGLAVVGVVGWRAYKAAKDAAGAAGRAWDTATAHLEQFASDAAAAVLPTVDAPIDPKPRALLYGDFGYAGTGSALDDYERELAALSKAYDQAWRMPAATSPSGAAFGIYPKP